MDTRSGFASRWKNDFDFKTIVTAHGSLAVTLIFALYNAYLGIRHSSVWHCAICFYYFALVNIRGYAVSADRRLRSAARREILSPAQGYCADRESESSVPAEDQERMRKKVYTVVSVLLLSLNLSLIVPISLMVMQERPSEMTLIPAIAMAAFTTFKIAAATVNLRKRTLSADGLVRLLRAISFIDALVSVLSLQNTLIMVNAAEDPASMLTFTAISSALILLVILLISAAAIKRGFASAKPPKEDPKV